MFVILGASGKVGQTTAWVLRQAGKQVRAVVRRTTNAEALTAYGCEIVVADLRDVDTLTDAIQGASAVQVICPADTRSEGTADRMQNLINTIGQAIEKGKPSSVLAISDYGAERPSDTGITTLFHSFENRLKSLPVAMTILRSAEHMQNWASFVKIASDTGVLLSLHHPLEKSFPTVSAYDVGTISAELLLEPFPSRGRPRVVHVEGPKRYSAMDVAQVISKLLRRDVHAQALPRTEWNSVLSRAGIPAENIPLITEVYEAHNAGLIDAEVSAGEIRRGHTQLAVALKSYAAENEEQKP